MSSDLSAVFFGVEIPETLLAAEMQNHTAASMKESRQMAGRALAAKAVLLARGEAIGLEPEQELNDNGQQETLEEAMIREVLNEEVDPAPPDPVAVRKIYDDQPNGFSTPPLLEASHILIAPRENDETSWQAAEAQAHEVLALLQEKPGKFFSLARTVSGCPSSSDGGSLGQLRPGDVLAVIWDVLLTLEPEHIANAPVKTEHGWHIVKLDHRVDGRRLPFEHVEGHIRSQLEMRAWTLAAAQYVDRLLRANAEYAPTLAISSLGELDRESAGVGQIHMVLGDIFSQPEKALSALDEDSLAILQGAAKAQNASPETVLGLAIPAFLNEADDEAWTKVISCLRESEAPLKDSLAVIVKRQFPKESKPSRVLDIGHRQSATPPAGKCHDHCC